MNLPFAKRIASLPPYLFAGIDKVKNTLIEKGVDVISLGIGDPDLPTPDFIVNALIEATGRSVNHRYPSYLGMLDFRKAVAEWYEKRFSVTLNPENEIISLAGSKEGIAHFPLAFVQDGDYVIVCPPNYPVYGTTSQFSGATIYEAPLTKENNFLPDLDAIPKHIAEKAKLIYVNYPNNPTSACASKEFYQKLIAFCKQYSIIIVHDSAYSEIYFSAHNKPCSIFEIEGAKDIAIEFHSLSKTYNMTGWRIGMAVGNKTLIEGLAKVKENVDSGVFQAIQEASIVGLRTGDSFCDTLRTIYKERRDIATEALTKAGITFDIPEATFYIWGSVPSGYTSAQYVTTVLEKTGVVLTPGSGFGSAGEGYFRISLTVGEDLLKEAMNRIASLTL